MDIHSTNRPRIDEDVPDVLPITLADISADEGDGFQAESEYLKGLFEADKAKSSSPRQTSLGGASGGRRQSEFIYLDSDEEGNMATFKSPSLKDSMNGVLKRDPLIDRGNVIKGKEDRGNDQIDISIAVKQKALETPAITQATRTGNRSTSRWKRVGRIGLGPPKRLAPDEELPEQPDNLASRPSPPSSNTPESDLIRPRKGFSPRISDLSRNDTPRNGNGKDLHKGKSHVVNVNQNHQDFDMLTPPGEKKDQSLSNKTPQERIVARSFDPEGKFYVRGTVESVKIDQGYSTPDQPNPIPKRVSQVDSFNHNVNFVSHPPTTSVAIIPTSMEISTPQHQVHAIIPQPVHEIQGSIPSHMIIQSQPQPSLQSQISSQPQPQPSSQTQPRLPIPLLPEPEVTPQLPQQAQSQLPSQLPSNLPSQLQVPQPQQQPQLKPLPIITINNRAFQKLELVGRGGSSKVYKVMAPNHRIFALKKVSLARADQRAQAGYINEINLLNRLRGHKQIIRLLDSEINHETGSLSMLMECGEIDLDQLLKKQHGSPVNFNFIRMYWEQMLSAVHAVHEQKIVHTDLKPANFVLVEGSLKLIDFGIAKAIANDTTNIHRDQQIGTVNYMSPEAIIVTNSKDSRGGPMIKQGRPSDVWSLGCILYQMVYGYTPFSKYTVYQKIQAIPNAEVAIEYPPIAVPPPTKTVSEEQCKKMGVRVGADILSAIECCLVRDSKSRWTIPQLLEHPFLRPERKDQKDGELNKENCIPGLRITSEKFVETVTQVLSYAQSRKREVSIEDAQQLGKMLYQRLSRE